jgi:hypothetical protein
MSAGSIGTAIRRILIFIYRCLGVALCLVFLIWFVSGIGMRDLDFPSVSAADRLEGALTLDTVMIRVSIDRSGRARHRQPFGACAPQ